MTAERSPAPTALEPGTLLGARYRLEERIGSGGAAIVWLAVDEVLDRHVAVKLLRPESAGDPDTAQRFRQEATAAAGVTHAHTVIVYDVGEHDGEPFLVMELIEGPTLADLIDATDTIPPALVVEIGRQVASALGAGHARGLVHRDVTPTNILFTTDGMTKLTDFGIALVPDASDDGQAASDAFGTVGYLAPERLAGEVMDARVDVFALGVILRECLTGQPDGSVGSDSDTGDGESPAVPPALAKVVARATAEAPDERFGDGNELATALEPLGDPELARDALARLVASAVPADRRTRARGQTIRLDEEDAVTGQARAGPLNEATPATTPAASPDDVTQPVPLPPSAVVTGGPQGGATKPGPAPPPDPDSRPTTGRSLLWLGLAIVGLAALAAALMGGGQDVPGLEAGERPRGEVPAAGPVPVRTGSDFDPLGDGSEHADEVEAAFDGDPETAWTTERYDRADLGGLKSGVGIWFDLGEPRPIRLIELDVTAGGGDVDLYALQSEPTGDPATTGSPVARVSGAEGNVRIELDEPLEGRYWLVWFTRVDAGRGGLNEVTFLPR